MQLNVIAQSGFQRKKRLAENNGVLVYFGIYHEEPAILKIFETWNLQDTRFLDEVRALKTLSHISYVPRILAVDESFEAHGSIIKSYVNGSLMTPKTTITQNAYQTLAKNFEELLDEGICPELHARNILIGPEGNLGLFDFDKCGIEGRTAPKLWDQRVQLSRNYLTKTLVSQIER